MIKSKFLIIGGSGLLGSYFQEKMGRQNAIATYYSRSIEQGIYFDIRKDSIKGLIEKYDLNFTHAIILSAITKIDLCAVDPDISHFINVECVIRTLKDIFELGIVPIYISSDAVYDGSKAFWSEKDATIPILTYGKQKLEVEHYMTSVLKPWLILRLSKVLHPETMQDGVLRPWVEALMTNQTIKCASDQRFSPICITDVLHAVNELAGSGAAGIFNVGGAVGLSRYELLLSVIEAVRRRRPVDTRISTCSIRDFSFVEPRPINLTMSIEKLKSTILFEPKMPLEICESAVNAYFK